MISVLVVDDDGTLARLTGDVLRDAGIMAMCACTSTRALELLESIAFDVLLTDNDLREVRNGLDLLKACQRLRPCTIRLLTSGALSLEVEAGLASGVVQAFLQKPVPQAKLLDAVSALVDDVTRPLSGVDHRDGPKA